MEKTDVTFEKGVGQRGFTIWYNGHRFVRNKTHTNANGSVTTYWHCEIKCGTTATTNSYQSNEREDKIDGKIKGKHGHPGDYETQEVLIFFPNLPLFKCYVLLIVIVFISKNLIFFKK